MQQRKMITAGILFFAFLFSSCKEEQVSLELESPDSFDSIEEREEKERENSVKEDEKAEEEKAQPIYVYVCGAVNNPDVYEMQEGDRMYQAVNMAGGMTEDAAAQYVSLAMEVEDGQRLYIPTKEEIESEGQGMMQLEPEHSGKGNGDLVNINKASIEELTALPGIGEAKAESILAYRLDKGSFQSIEELKEVKGIGDALFQKIKEKVSVK